MIRSGLRAIGIVVAPILVGLACAGSAYANRVTYTSASDPGVNFVLVGKGCPGGPRCFDHAKLTEFRGYWEVFPNCPQVNLSGGFEYGPFGGPPRTVKVDKLHFSGHGGSTEYKGDKVSFGGRFLRNRSKAKGWFDLTETNGGESCSTGTVHWMATASG
jgi:hypothetical protein